MSTRATGTFVVELSPLGEPQSVAEATLAQVRINKTLSGDIQGHSEGQMLSAVTSTPGSAGYVALEYVSAELAGRSGGFVLQHLGSMDRGNKALSITVVPDSGSGELQGISGRFHIDVIEGVHHYAFDYSLEASK